MPYKFIKTPDSENQFDSTKTVVTTLHNELTLDDMLGILTDFLRASGYIINGELTINERFKDADENEN